ncbi:hypothetical protein C8Q78DRAFT_278569 [Trametes maxima]|nr:hypothetical protein C8Q78DRAFT_278569 [Trametes maxima]
MHSATPTLPSIGRDIPPTHFVRGLLELPQAIRRTALASHLTPSYMNWFCVAHPPTRLPCFARSPSRLLPTFVSAGREQDGPKAPSSTIHDCLPEDRIGLPLLDAIDRVDVAMLASIKKACDWKITGYVGKTSFSIVFEAHTDFRDLPGELEAVFGRSPVAELRILAAFRNRTMHTVAEWARVLRLFPLIERIEFVNAAPWKGGCTTRPALSSRL